MVSAIDRAIGFAAKAHADQQRKTGNMPYIAHPVGVAMLLQQYGYEETIVIAGLLHDTVEDTPVTLEDLRQQFGPDVAEIVAGCTEPPKKIADWGTRKTYLIDNLRDAPLPVKVVAAADKYHNLSHTLELEQQVGEKIWKQFGRGKAQQAWYYRSALSSILANVPDPDKHPIFAQLAQVIDQLFNGVDSQPPTAQE